MATGKGLNYLIIREANGQSLGAVGAGVALGTRGRIDDAG